MKQPSWLLRWLASQECVKLRWELAKVRRCDPSRWVGGETHFYYNPREVALMARISWLKLRLDELEWSPGLDDWYWFDHPLLPWPEWRAYGEERARNELWNAYVNQSIEQAVEEWGIFKQPEEPFPADELAEWHKVVMAARAADARQGGET